jgi:hypothetical protein
MNTIISKSKDRDAVLGTSGTGTTLPFDGIREPGAYICLWSGHLLRVPETGIAPEGTPPVSVLANDSLMVTKIDDDPYIPVTQARLLAANQDVAVNF